MEKSEEETAATESIKLSSDPESEALNESDPKKDEPPPSYDTLYGKIKHVKQNSATKKELVGNVVKTNWCGTSGSIVSIIFTIAVPIACIVVGSLYLKQCPRERMIPIFLVVSGVFGLLRGLISTCVMIRNAKRSKEEAQGGGSGICDGVVGCFLLCWFIAGSVWTYSIVKDYQSVDPSAPGFCHEVVYKFSFWFLTVQYAIIALAILLVLCCCCVMCCAGGSK